MIQVLIVDDHKMARTGIRLFIERDTSISVIGEAEEGEQGVALCSSMKPDIVLMDINMPKMSGIEATKIIMTNSPATKIIVITGSSSKKEIQDSLLAGAKGYCLKDVSHEKLIRAIKTVEAGEIWIEPALKELTETLDLPEEVRTKIIKIDFYGLSSRELEVLALVSQGDTNERIAYKLNLGADTIKSHLRKIMDKLGVSGRTQAAIKAVREGLI